MTSTTIITLESMDGAKFTVERSAIECSTTIKNMIDDLGDDCTKNAIPLPNVSGAILAKVIKYAQHHAGDNKDDNKAWDKQFCDVEQALLFELILAANYLDIKPLLDCTCSTVANMLKGKTPEQIRQQFNITNDFTPEEEEQVRKENEWCEAR